LRSLGEVKRFLDERLGEDSSKYVEFFKVKGKPIVIVKPREYIPKWEIIQKLVKSVGGKWRKYDRYWEVPLKG